LNGTYATTGSNTFTGIQTVNSNLIVTGSITAQTLVVQTITSSVDFVTGSTRFGSILGNTHVFSGSVTMNPNGLFVSSSGTVGIGTISPVARLNIFGTSGNPSMTADTNNLFSITGNLGPQLNIGGYNGASYGMWLQVKNADNSNVNYPILLQPLGGAVGIGTTSALSVLDVRAANATMGNYQTIQAFSTDSAAINLGGGISLGGYYTSTTSIAQFASIVGRKENGTSANYDGYLAFGTNAQATGVVERMRITSGGNVLIGTTTDVAGKLQVNGEIRMTGSTLFRGMSSNTLQLCGGTSSSNIKINGASEEITMDTNGATRILINSAGGLQLNGATGFGVLDIGGQVNGVTANVCRIGNVSGFTNGLVVQKDTSNIFDFNFGASVILRSSYTYNNTSANVPNMYIGTSYDMGRGTSSSMRYKENIIDWEGGGINTILALKPRTFTYKEDYYKHPERVMLGLIAEEVAEVSPYLADYENEDRTGQVENVRYANIVVPLIKAIQELNTKLDAANVEIEALKSR
jgi:hypothetical protein